MGFISSSYTDELWAIYEDIMTYKHEKLMIQPCLVQFDSPYLF